MQKTKWLAIFAMVAVSGCGMAKDEHGYPEAVKSNFITACTKAGSTQQMCTCSLGKIETQFSYEKFREEDANATAGKQVSAEFQQATMNILRECMTAK